MFRLSALLGKGLYFAGDVCTIEECPEGVPGIPSDPTGSKHKALCTRPAWYWITMPGTGAIRSCIAGVFKEQKISTVFHKTPFTKHLQNTAKHRKTVTKRVLWNYIPKQRKTITQNAQKVTKRARNTAAIHIARIQCMRNTRKLRGVSRTFAGGHGFKKNNVLRCFVYLRRGSRF